MVYIIISTWGRVHICWHWLHSNPWVVHCMIITDFLWCNRKDKSRWQLQLPFHCPVESSFDSIAPHWPVLSGGTAKLQGVVYQTASMVYRWKLPFLCATPKPTKMNDYFMNVTKLQYRMESQALSTPLTPPSLPCILYIEPGTCIFSWFLTQVTGWANGRQPHGIHALSTVCIWDWADTFVYYNLSMGKQLVSSKSFALWTKSIQCGCNWTIARKMTYIGDWAAHAQV